MPCTNVTLFFGNVPPPKKKKAPYKEAPPVRALHCPSMRADERVGGGQGFQMMQIVLVVLRDGNLLGRVGASEKKWREKTQRGGRGGRAIDMVRETESETGSGPD